MRKPQAVKKKKKDSITANRILPNKKIVISEDFNQSLTLKNEQFENPS